MKSKHGLHQIEIAKMVAVNQAPAMAFWSLQYHVDHNCVSGSKYFHEEKNGNYENIVKDGKNYSDTEFRTQHEMVTKGLGISCSLQESE